MTGVTIRVDIDDEAVRRALARLDERAANLAPAMDEIGSMLTASIVHRFETETDPEGRPWQPLAISTMIGRIGGVRKSRKKKGGTRIGAIRRIAQMKILQDSARLRDSITHRHGRDFVEVGTNVVYGAIHQLGGQAGRGGKVTIPARPFLGVDAGDAAEITAILKDHIEGAVVP